MKKLLVFLSLVMSVSAYAAPQDPATGLWLTQNGRSVINIAPCNKGQGESLCGNIYWIIDGGMQTDAKNPDETKRETPMCGLPILWGFEKEREGVWEEGNIYKADDGDLYSADLEIQEDGTLKVRGYLGVSWLGKTQIWTRADAKDYKQCK